MDSAIGNSVQETENTTEAIGHSSKNIQIEQERLNETNYPQTTQNLDDEDYVIEEEESDEELFEDAIEELLVQDVLDCISNSTSSPSSQMESIPEDSTTVSTGSTSAAETTVDTSSVLLEQNSRQNMVQILFERRRNERALELRQLQYSSRPQEARNQLVEVINNNIITQQQRPTRNGNGISPLQPQLQSLSNPETYRPENVRNELSNLNSRQMVSNIPNIRESIERTLLNRLAGPSRVMSQNQVAPQAPVSRVETNNNHVAPQAPVLRVETNNNHIAPQAPVLRVETNNQVVPNQAPTVPVRPAFPYLQTRPGNNPLHDMYREHIVDEISELVHRELVSNTLQSNFRSRLEATVRGRMLARGIEANQTRQNIRQILANSRVTSTVQRNDFSHLGINSRNADLSDDNLDSASSISEQQQHRQRTTVIHHNNAREIRDLRSELMEMKSMLRLSFDMQSDMQRAFKQEISALVAGTFHDTASARVVNSSVPNKEGKCIICTESDCDTVLYQCGHMVSCYTCSLTLKNKGHSCPVCRAPIKDIVRTFKSSLQ